MDPQYIIFCNDPIIFSVGPFGIRWYSLLFGLIFFLAQPIGYYILKREGKPLQDMDSLLLYTMLGTVIGARLGHTLFYEFTYYAQHPLEIIFPVVFTATGFEITGYRGLASHGGAIGITIAIFLYLYRLDASLWPPKWQVHKRTRPGQSFLWLLDRMVILIALGASFIRMGNFMNEEILGRPTHSTYGVVFTHNVTQALSSECQSIDQIVVHKKPVTSAEHTHHYLPAEMEVTFKKSGFAAYEVHRLLERHIKYMLMHDARVRQHIYEPEGPLSYQLSQNAQGAYVARIATSVIPRHPAQLYESLSCLLLFFVLLLWWHRAHASIRPGSMTGVFLIYVFGLRFFYEFIKEGKVVLGHILPLHVGQWLSIPLVLIGILFLWYASRQAPRHD